MFVFVYVSVCQNLFFMHLDLRCGRQSPRGVERERRERWCVHTDAMHDCVSVCLSVCSPAHARVAIKAAKECASEGWSKKCTERVFRKNPRARAELHQIEHDRFFFNWFIYLSIYY